ncbi:MAG: hypothetical protein A3F72_08915 [Bacteroidetes bacterium RIFCSPLOWO2_12_FULL_35_15]|nr:MAG: hypothetical protein A3F72_08915 [Bacteroidetes bacterium RIFCSPLOWO2_12_FULL_35_15]
MRLLKKIGRETIPTTTSGTAKSHPQHKQVHALFGAFLLRSCGLKLVGGFEVISSETQYVN